ncbi:MAG: serine/threonine-protein kinase [Myxococcota bacterium]
MRTSPSVDARLRLLAPLGHGGMSDVWLGALRGPAGFEKLVAVKQLRFVQSEEYDRGQAFLREARLAAMLNHPNVVQTFEVMAQGGDYRIVMEFLEGQPLNRILRRMPGAIPLPDLVRVLVDVLAGLHHAHELRDQQGNALSVVHRDVSPHNVFVSYEGGVKLLDFGIAAFGRGEPTGDDLVKGKLAYMAPEQAAGGAIDRRADLFAVGAILWEILAGKLMWTGTPEAKLYGELVAGRIPSIDEGAPKAPLPLRRICARAVQKDPAKRFPNALAMRQALEDWLGSARPNALALGERVAEGFAADRARIKAIVAHSLSATDDEDSDHTDLYAPTPMPHRPRPAPSYSPPPPEPPAWQWLLVPVTGALSAAVLTAIAAIALAAAAGAIWWNREELGRRLAGQPQRHAVAAPGCPDPDGRARVELSGNIDADAELTCARDYVLSGKVRVQAGATLTVAPGTRVLGRNDSVLVVEPGGRLVADGRADAPIVFTSAADAPAAGDWGGVVLLGRAPTNLPDRKFKGLRPEGDLFGGDRADDDSGVLRYVRIDYAGMVLAPNNETNGLSLAGVGTGTVVDYVEVRHGADDCFEWFGGTVHASHLVCIDPGDDGLDIEFGYTGQITAAVVIGPGSTDPERHGIEVDSDPPGVTDGEPRTSPTLTGLTLCETAPAAGYGLVVRRGAVGTYADLWVDGYAAALDVRDRGGLEVRGVTVGPVTPVGPDEEPGRHDRSARADDDGGLDEAKLVQGARKGPRCAIPPVGAGALRQGDRWDEGWVVWE